MLSRVAARTLVCAVLGSTLLHHAKADKQAVHTELAAVLDAPDVDLPLHGNGEAARRGRHAVEDGSGEAGEGRSLRTQRTGEQSEVETQVSGGLEGLAPQDAAVAGNLSGSQAFPTWDLAVHRVRNASLALQNRLEALLNVSVWAGLGWAGHGAALPLVWSWSRCSSVNGSSNFSFRFRSVCFQS